jgi:hypothetical protein
VPRAGPCFGMPPAAATQLHSLSLSLGALTRRYVTVALLVAGGLIYTAAPAATYLASTTVRTSKRLAAKKAKRT